MSVGNLGSGLVILSLFAAAFVAPVADAVPVQGSLITNEKVTLRGEVDTRAEQGVLHARPPGLSDLNGSLEAEAVDVSYSWERGYGSPEVAGLLETRAQAETGNDTIRATNVTATISPFQDQPEVLGMLDPASSSLASQGDVDATARVVEDQVLTQIEWSNSSEQVTGLSDFHGFQYTVEAPWASATGLTTARISGTFDLFINNVTLDVSSSDTGAWAHWSGFRVQDETTGEYESRVTVLHVTNGTLELTAPGALGVYGPQLATTVSDGVQARHASGTLSTEEETYRFDPAPLRLSGPGEVVLSAQQAAGQARGDFSNERQSLLVLEPHGSFDVAQTRGLVVEQAPRSLGDSLGWWVPLMGVLILVGGIAYTKRDRVKAWYTHHTTDKRTEREDRWRRAGDKAFHAREYELALSWYQRMVDAYPNTIEGWNSLAATLEELGRYGEAADAYETTAGMMDEDTRLTAQAAGCAWRDGQEDRAVALAERVAEADPGALRQWLDGPRFQELRDHVTVQQAADEEPAGTGASYV